MRLRRFINPNILLIAGIVLCFACSNKQAKNKPEEGLPQLTEGSKNPFPFYKDIELRPGLNFEVLSWGKGVDSVGGYLILMSDSAKRNYKSLSAERNGVITDAWNMDLDTDGNPEIYIQLLSKKNVSDLNVYEYAGGTFNKISFPPLSSNQKKGYRGNDKFYIKEGDLFRSFEVTNPADSSHKSVGTKVYRYRLSGNTFSSTEVKEK